MKCTLRKRLLLNDILLYTEKIISVQVSAFHRLLSAHIVPSAKVQTSMRASQNLKLACLGMYPSLFGKHASLGMFKTHKLKTRNKLCLKHNNLLSTYGPCFGCWRTLSLFAAYLWAGSRRSRTISLYISMKLCNDNIQQMKFIACVFHAIKTLKLRELRPHYYREGITLK